MEHSFLVTIPSNVISFTENAMSSIRTVLSKKITLDDAYEVWFPQVSFTKSCINLPSNQEIFLYSKDTLINEDAIVVPQGFYKHIETLLTMINEKIMFFKDRLEVLPDFAIIRISRTVVILLGSDKKNKKVNVRLGYDLQQILGVKATDDD